MRLRRFTVILAALLGASGCARDGEAEGLIEREVFIEAYVGLRAAAHRSPTRQLTDAEREQVLSGHRVSEEQLLRFAEVRGADPAYMVALWTEINDRVNPPPPADVPSAGALPPDSAR